jgi:predicted porin
LKLDASFTYNYAKYNWDWDFQERISLTKPTGAPLGAYDTWEQNNIIDSYSDLTYDQYQITVGGEYMFTEALYTTATFTYDKFNSDEEYVYDDEDGKAYYSYVGVGYRF